VIQLRQAGNRRQDLVEYSSIFNRLPALIQVLQCLKKHGQRLDSEIAKETGIPLATVRKRVADLAAAGAVVTCNLTRFEDGKRIESWLCRVSGYIPPAAPGRKAKSTPPVGPRHVQERRSRPD
jgi:hypothetical protein